MIKPETLILQNLLFDDEFGRRVLPYLKPEYFKERAERTIFEQIAAFKTEYNALPTKESIVIGLEKITTLNQDTYDKAVETTLSLNDSKENMEWLVDHTEEFCQTQSLHNAILMSVDIMQGAHKHLSRESIPDLLKDALSVCFNNSIGHDFFQDIEKQYEYYHSDVIRIACDIDLLNRITNGGVCKKTLNVLMASTGVGKSLILGHLATAYIKQGKNVLYITMEMAEEMIRQRIDANVLNVKYDELPKMPEFEYKRRLEMLKAAPHGELIIKQYPTGEAHVGHFRHLLTELKIKKNFIPEIIIVDYINICSSMKIKTQGSDSGSGYKYVKAIAEELRGLAVETDTVMWSATQSNRGGYNNSDVDLTNTSESIGLPQTVDFMMVVMEDEELAERKQFLCKQLKNRYADPNKMKRFIIGVDKDKMRLFNVEQSAHDSIIKASPKESIKDAKKSSIGLKSSSSNNGIKF
jgi:replicative DNA helicase